jgi:transcriptional regulator with XRE-family HTH domain
MSELTSTARRRELGAALRQIREQYGLKGQDMAARMGWLPSQVSRAETGKRVMTPVEVATYTAFCDVSANELAELLHLAAEPEDYRIKPHLGQMPDELRTLIFHEQTASSIDIFEPIYVPGLLQTEDYIRALFHEFGALDAAKIDECAQIRLSRRSILTRIYPPQCQFFVHENALRTPIGGPRVMQEQMLHLLFSDTRPQSSIRVVPTSAGGSGTAAGSFHIFRYGEGKPVVYLQHETTSDFLESHEDLEVYRATLNRVARVALGEGQSRDLIARIASDYERQGAAQHDEVGGMAQEHL